MSRLLKTVVAGLAAAMIAGSALAQAAPAPSPRQVELARRYVVAMNMDQSFEGMMKSMLPIVQSQMRDAEKLTPEQHEVLAKITLDASRRMMSKMMAKMPVLLAEVFTEQELEGLVNFYESPIGQSLIAKSPQLSAKMAPLMPELMSEMRTEMMSRICELVACPASPGTVEVKPKPS